MNERDKLIEMLIKEKGGTRKQYLQLMNKIANHESAGTMDPSMRQMDGGPGRGKYQFEEGESKGGQTAINRMHSLYKEKGFKMPKWLIEGYKTKSYDASKLTSNQQDALFLANMKGHPKANFKNVWEGNESTEDFWLKYHWGGKKSSVNFNRDKANRRQSFKESEKNFDHKPYYESSNVETPTSKDYSTPYADNSLGDFLKNYNNDQNKMSLGGKLGITNNKQLNSFEGGGTHEQNSLGGIPQGIGANGKPNTVEEGETSFQLKGGKYIFSDRIKTNSDITEPTLLNNQFSNGGNIDPIKKPKERVKDNIQNPSKFSLRKILNIKNKKTSSEDIDSIFSPENITQEFEDTKQNLNSVFKNKTNDKVLSKEVNQKIDNTIVKKENVNLDRQFENQNKTFKSLDAKKTYRQGQSGTDIEELQEFLLNFNNGEFASVLDKDGTSRNLKVDGKFGKNTKNAIEKYQKSQGLKADGIVGKKTLQAMTGGNPVNLLKQIAKDEKKAISDNKKENVKRVSNFQKVMKDKMSFITDYKKGEWGKSTEDAFTKFKDYVNSDLQSSYIPSISKSVKFSTGMKSSNLNEDNFSEDELELMRKSIFKNNKLLNGFGYDGIRDNSELKGLEVSDYIKNPLKLLKSTDAASITLTLGQAGVMEGPDGNVYVYDIYDFNDVGDYEKDKKTPSRVFLDRVASATKNKNMDGLKKFYSLARAKASENQRKEQIASYEKGEKWKPTAALINLGSKKQLIERFKNQK